MKASPSGGEITPLIISPIWGGELQTWVRGAGIDIPISANNESFPLGSEGGLGKEDGRGEWEKGDRRGEAKREVGLLLHSHTHRLHWKPLLLSFFFYWTAEDGEYPNSLTEVSTCDGFYTTHSGTLKTTQNLRKRVPEGRRLEEKFSKNHKTIQVGQNKHCTRFHTDILFIQPSS